VVVLGQEASPALEGHGIDAERSSFVGGGDEPENSCAPLSSRAEADLVDQDQVRSEEPDDRPTELSARPGRAFRPAPAAVK